MANEQQEGIVSEIEIESVPSEQEDEASGPVQYDLLTYPADFTLEVLHQKWFKKEISIPPVQRGFVWKITQASRLIESFLLGLPVPPIFLHTEKGSEALLVVDGQQRLRTIFFFFEGNFGEEQAGKRTVFRLELDRKSKWYHKTLTDLEEEEARRLKNSVLRAYIMRQLSPDDQSSLRHVFERLNTGGTLLNPQEVRNCIYEGPFSALLRELNTHKSWRLIVGRDKPDTRLKDVELILRFLALSAGLEQYQRPLKEFLSVFMRRNKDGKANETFKNKFLKTSDEVRDSLGDKPFHTRRALNAATFDAVFIAFARREAGIPSDVRGRYESLVGDPDFKKLTLEGTTDADRVRERVRLAVKHLFS